MNQQQYEKQLKYGLWKVISPGNFDGADIESLHVHGILSYSPLNPTYRFSEQELINKIRDCDPNNPVKTATIAISEVCVGMLTKEEAQLICRLHNSSVPE